MGLLFRFFQCCTYLHSLGWVAVLFVLLSATRSLWLSLSPHHTAFLLYYTVLSLWSICNFTDATQKKHPKNRSAIGYLSLFHLYCFLLFTVLTLHPSCLSQLKPLRVWINRSKVSLKETFGGWSSGMSVLYAIGIYFREQVWTKSESISWLPWKETPVRVSKNNAVGGT